MYGILLSRLGWCPQLLLRQARQATKMNMQDFGPSLAASLEPLAHLQNVACLSLFYKYYFGRCSTGLAQLVPLPFSQGRSTCCSDRLHDFSVTIPRCDKDVYVNSFVSLHNQTLEFFAHRIFPQAYNLNGFKFRINRHFLIVGSL